MTGLLQPQTYGPIAQFISDPGIERTLKIQVVALGVVVLLTTIATVIGGVKALRALRAEPGADKDGIGTARPLGRKDALVALSLLVLALAMRWLNLGAESISSQEISYLYNAVPPRSPGLLWVLIDVTDFNPHSPGFRWAMAWWSRLSVDLGWLRAGPAAGAALLAPILHLWLARRGLAREGAVAGLLAALSPLAMFVGRTTMPFGATVSALAAAAWAQDELLSRGGRRWAIAFAAAAAVAMWLSYAGGSQLAVLLVAGLLRARHSRALLRRLARGWVLAVLMGLPLLWQVSSFLFIRSRFALTIYQHTLAQRGPIEAVTAFFGVGAERLAGGFGEPGIRAAVFVVLCAIGVLVLLRRNVGERPVVLPLAAGFVLFSAIETFGFALDSGVTYVALRRFVLVIPFAMPLAGVGLVAIADGILGRVLGNRRGLTAVVSLAAATAIGVPQAQQVIQGGLRPQVREAVAALIEQIDDGDALLFGPVSFFDSVFAWHAGEQGVPGVQYELGPNWTQMDSPRGPVQVLISHGDTFVSAPISAAPLDVRRVWVLQLLEQPLGLRELNFDSVERYRSGLTELGFESAWQLRLRRVELDRWDRLPPEPPEPFVIEAGRTDYPFVRGTCPASWLPADERTLVRGSVVMLPALAGQWTLEFEGSCTGRCPDGLDLGLPEGVTATRRRIADGFALDVDTTGIEPGEGPLVFELSDPDVQLWDLRSFAEGGCPDAAATYRRIVVRFAPPPP
jgi:hypothetical protein